MTKCHPISNEVTPSFLTLTFSPEKSNGDLGLSLKQILLSSGWRGISINHLIIKSQKFNSINIKYDCKCLKVLFIVIYTMLGFITHKGQMLCYLVFSFLIVVTLKFQMLASMIFWNVCKYFILRDSRRALPWFCAHVRWHRGNHPPLKRSVVLKRICLCLCISHCLCFVPLRRNNCFCEVTSSSLVLLKVLHLCHNVATRCVESVPLILRQWQAGLHILCWYYWGPLWSVNVVGCWLLDQL